MSRLLIAMTLFLIPALSKSQGYPYPTTDFTYNGVVYSVLDEQAKTCMTKPLYNSPNKKLSGDVVLDAYPQKEGVPYRLIEVAEHSFCEARSIESVVIPSTVERISVEAFMGCSSLKSVTISSSVQYIGSGAFSNCTSLTTAVIPNSVTYLGPGAFAMCERLKTAKLSEQLTTIEFQLFGSCSSLESIVVPSGVTEVDDNAFEYCYELKSVNLPASLEKIGDSAFAHCYTLADIANIENSNLKTIGSSAFCSTVSLPGLQLPPTVVTIGENAFTSSGISKINLPASLSSIGEGAFSFTGNLRSIELDPMNLSYMMEDEVIYDAAKTILIVSQTGKQGECQIPASVKKIDAGAFYNCDQLAEVAIPESVTEIGQAAFYNCAGLASVKVPDSVTEMGISVFAYCENLSSVSLSESLTVVPNSTFMNCLSLRTITFPKTIESIEGGAFYNVSGMSYMVSRPAVPPATSGSSMRHIPNNTPVYVPTGSAQAYEAADEWKRFRYIEVDPDNVHFTISREDSELELQNPYHISAFYVHGNNITPVKEEWVSSNPYCATVEGTAENGFIYTWHEGQTDISYNVTDSTGKVHSIKRSFTVVPSVSGVNEVGVDEEAASCDVYSVDGKLLRVGVSLSDNMGLPAGVYIFRATDGTTFKRVVK